MRQEIHEIFHFSITVREVIGNTLWATLCGSLISVFYFFAIRRGSYSVNIIKSIVMLTMITAFVMMVVGDNLAQAFSMVGILSIIRFRTAMKGAQDFMFLFFALGIGLACGEGLYLVALAGCLLIGIVTIVMTQASNTVQDKNCALVIILNELESSKINYKDIFMAFCKDYRLVSVKAFNKDNNLFRQLRYAVSIRKSADNEEFVKLLKSIEGIREVNLVFEED